MNTNIDTTFDFQTDIPLGKDPDAFSPTLRRYHKVLWSKPLPCGIVFKLVDTTPKVYLHHQSEVGEFYISSDSAINSFRHEKKIKHIIDQIPIIELVEFRNISFTIGGMIVFPGNRIDNKITINGARGFHPLIKDRFDLTVECIRRHYLGKNSPLSETLSRYKTFFNLFESFRGYVEFFLLQDLVSVDFCSVKFFLPFDDFKKSPMPSTLESYKNYKQSAIEFIEARNHRILDACC